MFKSKRILNYANVTATLALVFSMGGGAMAANHYLINSTSQVSPKVLKKLKGKNGANGVAGPQGATGPQGSSGPQGPTGPAGAPNPNAINATNATNATNAVHATTADTATTANGLPALTWTALTLENAWTPYSGWGEPSYTKDAEGFVHLRGALDGSSKTGGEFATLPEGFRPASGSRWMRASSTNGAFDPQVVDVVIRSSGRLTAYSASGATDAFVSLEGVTFYAG